MSFSVNTSPFAGREVLSACPCSFPYFTTFCIHLFSLNLTYGCHLLSAVCLVCAEIFLELFVRDPSFLNSQHFVSFRESMSQVGTYEIDFIVNWSATWQWKLLMEKLQIHLLWVVVAHYILRFSLRICELVSFAPSLFLYASEIVMARNELSSTNIF